MTDLKIITIGPETIAGYNGAGWPQHNLPISHAVVALTYPAGDIVAVDVFDHNDALLIERGIEDFTRENKGPADAIASRIALTARLVIRSDKHRITAPGTIADGGYQLP
tara:strand:- start:3690 stop:4016 length:327 start_codon:yes stop_codon:yes gene_type:complete